MDKSALGKKFTKDIRDYGRKSLMESHKKRHATPMPNAMPMPTSATPAPSPNMLPGDMAGEMGGDPTDAMKKKMR